MATEPGEHNDDRSGHAGTCSMRPSVAQEESVAMERDELQDEQDESQPIPAGMRYEHGKVVPHLTLERAGGTGQGGAPRGATGEPRRVHAGDASPRPGRAARASGGDPGARAGADPLRPDAGVAVHVLPGRGADHGGRSGRHAPFGDHDPAVRRRSPDELRGVRLAGAAAGVRHQRLRRDLPGAVGVGRQAARRQLRDRRARQRLHDQGTQEGPVDPARRLPHRRCASSPA